MWNWLTRSRKREPESVTDRFWRHLEANPARGSSPWGRHLGEANHCAANRDWLGAELAYLQAAKAATGQPMLQAFAFNGLSGFYHLLERPEEARAAARAASKAVRPHGKSLLSSCILQCEAALHLKAGDLDSARRLIDEALAVIEGNELADQQRATAAVLRAECRLKAGQLAEARLALTRTWDLLAPHNPPSELAGAHSALAEWWTTTARVRAAERDLAGVVEAWREVVRRRRLVAHAPQIEGIFAWNALAVTLHNLGMALRALGDRAADEAFQESASMRRAIGLPPLNEG